MALTDKLSAIGDAIRAGTGKSGLLTLDEMPGEIAGLGSGGGGGGGAPPNDVNFFDYDGTILYSYTVEEVAALTELPPLPTRPGLICQGWNWTLEGLQAAGRAMNVGAMYITDDGKTRLYIRIATEGRMTVPLYISQTVANGVTIDWGDGSATETLAGTGNVNTAHTYSAPGDYTITLDPADGCEFTLGNSSTSYCVMGSVGNNGLVYCNMLQKAEIGRSVTSIGNSAFRGCYSLASITVPESVTSIAGYVFHGCCSLASVTIPGGVTTIMAGVFENCYALSSVTIPDGVTSIGGYAFRGCCSLASVTMPGGVIRIGNGVFENCCSLASVTIPGSVDAIRIDTFENCYGSAVYDFTRHTAVPYLAVTSAFTGIPSDCVIKVPAALEAEWKAATNWATYADYIVGV